MATASEKAARSRSRSRRLSRPSAKSVATVAELARSVMPRVPILADRLVGAIVQSDEAYRERGLVPSDDLWRSCHDNLTQIISGIAMLPHTDTNRDAPHATGRRRAEQGLPLENLLHAFRLGGRVIWEGLLEECRAHPDPPIDGLTEGAVLVWDVVDDFSAAVGQAYRQAEADLLRRDATQRQSLLHSLLTGMATDQDLSFAAEILDFPRSGPYLVAVADPRGATSTSGRALAAALTSRHIRSEWLTREERLVGLVAPRQISVPQVRDYLAASGRHRIGLSPPTDELAQVPVAYRHAELALQSIPPGRAEVASLDDRLEEALLLASPELARRLARNVLGPLLDLPEEERVVVVRTLRAYIDSGGSLARVATELSCHRNTVTNRIRRIQDLTGLSPTDSRQLTRLALALQASDLLSIESSTTKAPST